MTRRPIYELRQKATMQLLRKYDNKSSKVKNKFKLIVLKILLVVVIVAGAAGISSGIGVMKGIIDSAPTYQRSMSLLPATQLPFWRQTEKKPPHS